MPDAAGNIKGSGWSREREAGWERVFGQRGAFERALAAEVEGWHEQAKRDDERVLRGHYGDPAPEGAGSDVSCDCGPDDCPCCCRCGC